MLDKIFVIVVSIAIAVLAVIFFGLCGYTLWGIATGNIITKF